MERFGSHYPEEHCPDSGPQPHASGAARLEAVLTRRGKGVKILAIAGRPGLPLSVSAHPANHHKVKLVQVRFNFYMLEAKREDLIGDRAYDSWAR